MIKLLLALVLAASAAPPLTPECFGPLGLFDPRATATDRLAWAVDDSLAKIRLKHTDVTEISFTTKPHTRNGRIITAYAHIGGRKVPMGTIAYDAHSRGSMEFRRDVKEGFRDAGVSRLLLLRALEENPATTEIDATLVDTNAAAFLAAAPGKLVGDALRARSTNIEGDSKAKQEATAELLAEFRGLSTSAERQGFRERLIDAYLRHTPEGRTNVQAGFGGLRDLQIHFLEDGSIEITTLMTRGPLDIRRAVVQITDGFDPPVQIRDVRPQ